MVEYHRGLLNEARQKGFGLADGRRLPDLELLTELQHFGAATCMLDFTESALVALYFSCLDGDCKDGKGRKCGKIFCVPHSNIATAPEDKKIFTLLQGSKPYQWRPTMHGAAERRIICQSGLSLINLSGDPDGLKEITIPADDKEEILEELKNKYQISTETLFIDLSGFSQNHASGKGLADYKVYFFSGNTKLELGQYKAAIDDYKKAIDLKPDYAEAYINRGGAKAEWGQYTAAIKGL